MYNSISNQTEFYLNMDVTRKQIHKRPVDYSIIITLLLALIIPGLFAAGGVLYTQKAAFADTKGVFDVIYPEEDEILRSYTESLAYTKAVTPEVNEERVGTRMATSGTRPTLTQPGQSRVLEVPYFEQIYTLSCEVANVQMILNFFGISNEDQDTLMEKMGYATPFLPEFDENDQMIWGDPDKGFVGQVDGFMIHRTKGIRGATGWGTSNKTVARLMKQFYPKSYADSGSTTDLKRQLDSGNPVIFWHVRDDMSLDVEQYKTPEGKIIELKQYHVALINGYLINEQGQAEYVVSDPEFGIFNISEEDLNRQWGRHNYDMVVAIK